MADVQAATAPAFNRRTGEPTLTAIAITKDFATLRANDGIDFSIMPGDGQTAAPREWGGGDATLRSVRDVVSHGQAAAGSGMAVKSASSIESDETDSAWASKLGMMRWRSAGRATSRMSAHETV